MKLKLSKVQQNILDLMNTDWELSESLTSRRYWLQQGGSGKGGDTKKVASSTVSFLLKNNLIELNERKFPKATYKIKSN